MFDNKIENQNHQSSFNLFWFWKTIGFAKYDTVFGQFLFVCVGAAGGDIQRDKLKMTKLVSPDLTLNQVHFNNGWLRPVFLVF